MPDGMKLRALYAATPTGNAKPGSNLLERNATAALGDRADVRLFGSLAWTRTDNCPDSVRRCAEHRPSG